MNVDPYVGEPHEMLGRIRHEDLLARADEARQLRELRGQEGPTRSRPAARLLHRLRALVARRGPRRAARLAR